MMFIFTLNLCTDNLLLLFYSDNVSPSIIQEQQVSVVIVGGGFTVSTGT